MLCSLALFSRAGLACVCVCVAKGRTLALASAVKSYMDIGTSQLLSWTSLRIVLFRLVIKLLRLGKNSKMVESSC